MTLKSEAPNARSGLSRDEILRVSADLFRKRGYRATSLQEVADHFGVRRPAIYYWFKSKSDILLEIHQRFMDILTTQLDEILRMDISPDEKLIKIISSQIDTFSGGIADLATFIENESELPDGARQPVREAKRYYQQAVEQIYRDGVASGAFADLNPYIAASTILGMTNWMYRWYRPDGRHSVHEVASTIVHLARHGYLKHQESPNDPAWTA